MRLLIYGLNYAPEPVGIGKYTGELACWFSAQGHDVHVITAPSYYPGWRARDNRYRRERQAGVSIWRCPLWVPRRPSGLTRLLHLASFALSSLPVLLRQIRRHPDVTITVAPAFFCAPGALLLSALCGRRNCNWLHMQDFELDAAFELGLLRGGLLRRMAEHWERSTLRGFDRVSTISEAMRQKAIQKGVDPARALLLPNWVDLQTITPQPAVQRAANPYQNELNLPPNACILMYSGSMNRKQGLELLAEVIRQLEDEQNLIWLLAGEGPTRQALEAATAGLTQVRMLPLQPIERLNDWLNLADIHLLPQKAEAADLVLPSKLLGILASGRPVIASSPVGSELGQLAEQAGVRVDPGDASAFAEAVRLLVRDPKRRHTLGYRGRQIAEERFGSEKVMRALEQELVQGIAATAMF